jgi:alcohol dehydrogenase/acrylyl-CoA reductase (NADPH)
MSNFKAIVLNKTGDQFAREVKSIDKSFLIHGDVLVKVDYSDFNYKDGMILKNGGSLVKDYPHIPGIDFAGTVEESKSDKFKAGDKVILTGWRVGEIYYGGYSQYAKVDANFLVKAPKDISTKHAMAIGTAGFTALLCSFAVQARETILLGEKVNDVLVTGATGGVGSVAVMILSKMGYKVHALTGKKDKTDFLKKLGASVVLDRSELEGEIRPLDKALTHTKPTGIVAACGLTNSFKLETTVMPFIIRGVKLWGINSVDTPMKRREFVWSQAASLIDMKKLDEITEVWSMSKLLSSYEKILKGEVAGRVVIDVNE